ncbi:unnamed protein product [Withania somnifera]
MTYLPTNFQSNDSNPPWMNKADNAWQLTSASLVGLQSVPEMGSQLGFDGPLCFCEVLVCWVGWGYQLAFGDTLVPFLGKPNIDALEQKYLMSQAFIGKFPNASMVYFRFLVPSLGRMNFIAWMLFVPLWLTFSYTVGAFSIWCPQGWSFGMGVIDYSEVLLFTRLTVFLVGPRAPRDGERFPPNNILLMLAGAGILWMGWTGFNGGDPYVASLDASLAVLNTHVRAAATNSTGVVQGWAAILMGLMSGCIPWFGMMFLHKKMWLLKQVDDTMAVLGRIFYMVDDWPKYTGLAYGIQSGKSKAGFEQLWVQLIGIGFVFIWNVVSTSAICLLIRMVGEGDNAVHGEEAYAVWGDGEKFDNSKLRLGHEIEELPLSKSGCGL